MQDALIITTAIAVLLFVGVLCSWVSKRFRVPDVLLLILAGMFFGHIDFRGAPLIQFPEVFLSALAILALAMIVFDSTARLRLRDLDTFSLRAVKLSFMAVLFTLVFFTAAVHVLVGINLLAAFLFSAIMVGTAPETFASFTGKSRALTILKIESLFNTPLTVILPFLVLDMQNISTPLVSEIIEQLVPFIMKFIVGIGSGVFVGIILFKIVQRVYAEVYSPLAVIVATLLSYVLSENLGGSGVLAVTALGIFFGNVYVKEKTTLLDIEGVMAKALYILVFILTGLVIKIPYTKEFLALSGTLFGIYLAVRLLAVWLSFRTQNLSFAELIYMTLAAPKGVATVAVVFILAVRSAHITQAEIGLPLIFSFILYSIILASITGWIATLHHEKRTARHKLSR